MSKNQQLTWLREDEIRYRARGLFDMADQVRRLVEFVEQGVDFPPTYSVCDRGTHRPIDGWLDGGMAIVLMPNAGLNLCLTPDRAASLAVALLHWLESFV